MSWNGFRVVGTVEDDTQPNADSLVEQLKILLADVSVFYHTVHQFHWNVKGANFYEYHKFYDEIVNDVYDSIDPIAENIKKLDHETPYNMSDLLKLTTLKETDGKKTDPKALTYELIILNSQVIDTLNKTFALATKENQQGIANFIAERIDGHQKWNWFLKASNEG